MGNISKIMEFIKNNLAILITASVAVASGIFNAFQYFENKKLKRYGTEKDLKQRRADLDKACSDHRSSSWMFPTLGGQEKEKNEVAHKKKFIEAEIEYLEKILKIKNHD